MVVLPAVAVFAGCSDDDECVVENYQISYMRYIDLASSNDFDCENPNYGVVSLPSSDNKYNLTGEETYQLTSQFNCLSFNNSSVSISSTDEQFLNKIDQSIDILVSYRWVIDENNNDDAIAHFYVCQDGMVIILGAHNWSYWCTDSKVISYESFKGDVERIIGNA